MLDTVSGITSPANAGSVTDAGLVSLRNSAPAAATDGSPDFGAMLAQLANTTVSALKTGEATALAGMQGQASTQQVVEAVMTAEQTLQSAIAIRDKVVSAFLEISRMSI